MEEPQFQTAAECLREQHDFDGPEVEVPVENHPEYKLPLPEQKVKILREKHNKITDDLIFDEYIHDKYRTSQTGINAWFRPRAEDPEAIITRRLRIAHAILYNDVDNDIPSIAEAADVDTEVCREDIKRLRELVSKVSYEQAEISVPQLDLLWTIVKIGEERKEELAERKSE